MEYLSVREVAALKGCSERNIQKLIAQGKLHAEERPNPGNRIKQYRVPLSALPANLQRKHLANIKTAMSAQIETGTTSPSLDGFTDDERRQIAYWTSLVDEWQSFRSNPAVKNKCELDDQFILFKQMQGVKVSERTLYRAWTAVKAGDLEALTERRGQARKGQTAIHGKLWDAFLYYYLDQNKLSMQKCHELTKYWAKQFYPELVDDMPSYHAFRRRVKEIDKSSMVYRREGEKAYDDRCAPYIDRLYDDLRSNEYWIADNHTLDVISRTLPGSPEHRLHVTAFIDALSGIFTGINLTLNPCADSTRLALRSGIRQFGVPDNIYVDNGSEFLTHDIGGRGHRTKRKYRDEEQPPTIFALLGINMVNALVRNAKAKPIERTFGTLKGTFSKLWDTYCGGNITERPEKLKKVLKQDSIPLDSEIKALLTGICFGYYNNQPYTGKVKRYRGMTRMEVYKANLIEQRTSTEENLNLLLMRHTRLQKIGRRGVSVTIAGQKLDYYNERLLSMQSDEADKRVYVRYDPDDMNSVYVYDIHNKYIMTVPMDELTRLRMGDTKDKVAAANRGIRAVKKAAKVRAMGYGSLPAEERITAMALMALEAARHKDDTPVSGKVIIPVRPGEASVPAVSGGYDVLPVGIDQEKMNRNRERNLKGAM